MKLAVTSYGQGPDVVLLHGWGMHAGFWPPLAEALAKRFTVHCVDLPGHGQSPAGDLALDVVVDALMRRFPFPVVPIAWSLGGLYALEWARRAPQHLARLVLLAVNPCFVQREDWSCAMPSATLQAFTAAFAEDAPAVLNRFVGLMAKGEAQARSLIRQWGGLAQAASFDRASLLQGLQVLAQSDLRDIYPRLPQPILLLYGAHDGLVPTDVAHWMHGQHPLATLCLLDHCAHAPHLTQTTACLEAIANFLV